MRHDAPEGVDPTLEALADALRPDLHRYASRLTGSVVDGEDVVQDTLARALPAFADWPADRPLRPWLFRIAHNRAVDLLRRRQVRRAEPLEAASRVHDPASDPESILADTQALGLAIRRFAALPVPQRSAVILKDVLDTSLADIADLLDLSVDAVKAHLARGRARLRVERAHADAPPPPASPEARAFAALFDRRDWEALRALLAEDVRLDQARRPVQHGAKTVGMFFTYYDRYAPVRLQPAWLHGHEVLLVFEAGEATPRYFMALSWRCGRVSRIRDHRYAHYVLDGVFDR